MDAIFAPYEQRNMFSNPTRKNTCSSISKASTENLAPMFNNMMYGPCGGMFYGPPHGLSYSYPPPSSFNPPLLPLPISKPYRTQSFSHAQVKKSNKPTFTKDLSLYQRKSKQTNKRNESNKRFVSNSTVPLGHGPSDLPKHVPNVLGSFHSGSVFSLSPPPSSLPLPKFSMRPKLSCTAEAAGNVDAGATDNLRRILRLR